MSQDIDPQNLADLRPGPEGAAMLARRINMLDIQGQADVADALIPLVCERLAGCGDIEVSDYTALICTASPEILRLLPAYPRYVRLKSYAWSRILGSHRLSGPSQIVDIMNRNILIDDAFDAILRMVLEDASWDDLSVQSAAAGKKYAHLFDLLTVEEWEPLTRSRPDLVERMVLEIIDQMQDWEPHRIGNDFYDLGREWPYFVIYLALQPHGLKHNDPAYAETQSHSMSRLMIASSSADSAHAKLRILELLGPLQNFIRDGKDRLLQMNRTLAHAQAKSARSA